MRCGQKIRPRFQQLSEKRLCPGERPEAERQHGLHIFADSGVHPERGVQTRTDTVQPLLASGEERQAHPRQDETHLPDHRGGEDLDGDGMRNEQGCPLRLPVQLLLRAEAVRHQKPAMEAHQGGQQDAHGGDLPAEDIRAPVSAAVGCGGQESAPESRQRGVCVHTPLTRNRQQTYPQVDGGGRNNRP